MKLLNLAVAAALLGGGTGAWGQEGASGDGQNLERIFKQAEQIAAQRRQEIEKKEAAEAAKLDAENRSWGTDAQLLDAVRHELAITGKLAAGDPLSIEKDGFVELSASCSSALIWVYAKTSAWICKIQITISNDGTGPSFSDSYTDSCLLIPAVQSGRSASVLR